MKSIGKKNLIEEIALELRFANNITSCHSDGYNDAAELIVSRLQELRLVTVDDDGDVTFGKDYYEHETNSGENDEPEDDLSEWKGIQDSELNTDDIDFEPCSNCDMPDACEDFGCAIKTGVRKYYPIDGVF